MCSNVQAVKYVHSYIYEGEGSIALQVTQNLNKIITYFTAWCIRLHRLLRVCLVVGFTKKRQIFIDSQLTYPMSSK
jgi:hypothetical protein